MKGIIMGKAKRKQRPQPPRWFNWDTDNCYFCKNRNGCGNCKVLKPFKKQFEKYKNL